MMDLNINKASGGRMSVVNAVIILYHPNLKLLRNLVNLLANEVEMILLIDNGGGFKISDLRGEFDESKVVLYSPDINLGVAAAINIGVLSAIDRHADYIVTFDQDSILSSGLVTSLKKTAEELEKNGVLYASVSPRYFDINSQKYLPFYDLPKFGFIRKISYQVNLDVSKILTPITSGTLYSSAVLKKVGVFESDLFIDHVDHEWSFRALAAGYPAYCNWKQTLHHQIGELSKLNIILRRRVKLHKPLRNYYYFRNSIAMLCRSYIPLAWRLSVFADLLKKLVAATLLWDEKGFRLSLMALGVWDAIRGKSGKLNPERMIFAFYREKMQNK